MLHGIAIGHKNVFYQLYLLPIIQESYKYHLANDMISLPVDQRYTIEDMNYICDNIEGILD